MPPPPDPFDPLDFLTCARITAQQQTEGALLRTAVSRAYYCVFHIARQYTGINRAYGGNSIHWEILAARKAAQRGYIGQKIEELFRLRKGCRLHQLLPNRREDRDWELNWKRAESIAAEIIPELLDAESKGEAGGDY